MPTAILGIGIPGSGKTTYLKALAERQNALYVCPDDTRELLTGDPGNQTMNREVWEIVYYSVGHALYNGIDVIIDSTNTKVGDRKRLVEHCSANATMIIGVWFTVPLSVCLTRNSERERVVPPRAIMKMYKQLLVYPPRKEEGFDLLLKKK